MESIKFEDLSKQEFEAILDEYSDSYYNQSESKISDEEFDNLVELYNQMYDIKYKKIGCSPPETYKEVLPKYMGSLDKVKTEVELARWMKKYPKDFILSDKIDGVSALYDGKKLWTRGDGYNGTNITHILKYIRVPSLPNDFKSLIRGELVISKKNFDAKYKSKMSNARNMVTGLLNPFSKIPNTEALRDLVFVAYEYDDTTTTNGTNGTLKNTKSQLEQLKLLNQLGFTTPFYIQSEKIDIPLLSELLIDRKQNSEYEVDGVVIVYNYPYTIISKDNPDHTVAFKMEGEFLITEVKSVEWNVSKHKVLKPRVSIEPVQLSGVEIKWVTGHNAKFIRDNGVGKGAKIKITRSGDVIPYIKEVIVKAVPDFPESDVYKWNTTNVDILLIEETDDVKKRKILEFFKCLDAKNIGKSTVDTLYSSLKIDTLKKFFNLTPNDILCEGIREKKAQKIIEAIQTSITDVDLIKVASASGTLGMGFGERKIKAIIDVYPSILDMDCSISDIEKMIQSIRGFKTMSGQFAKNIHLLKMFLKQHPEIKIKKYTSVDPSVVDKDTVVDTVEEVKQEYKNSFSKTIVFTGVRDKDLESEIEKRGGKVSTSVSKNTDILVTSKRYSNSSKEIKADQLNKEVLTLEEFKIKYKF
jgi:NAD-dependent DNA ligase